MIRLGSKYSEPSGSLDKDHCHSKLLFSLQLRPFWTFICDVTVKPCVFLTVDGFFRSFGRSSVIRGGLQALVPSDSKQEKI